MKRLVAFIMVFLMITGLAACKSNKAEQVESEEPIDYEEQAENSQEAEESSGKLVGGWEISDVGEAELPESVKSAFEKATESLTGNDLVPVAYIGQQVVQGMTAQDNVSQLGHILGGMIGATAGYFLNKKSKRSYKSY